MTRDEIVQMAWDCGILMRSHNNQEEPTKLERFAALVAAAEREACAKVCEEMVDYAPVDKTQRNYNKAYEACVAAIRARGEKS